MEEFYQLLRSQQHHAVVMPHAPDAKVSRWISVPFIFISMAVVFLWGDIIFLLVCLIVWALLRWLHAVMRPKDPNPTLPTHPDTYLDTVLFLPKAHMNPFPLLLTLFPKDSGPYAPKLVAFPTDFAEVYQYAIEKLARKRYGQVSIARDALFCSLDEKGRKIRSSISGFKDFANHSLWKVTLIQFED